eukprot:TRINITY_DN5349_c0_g1_i2.p1 TRINITY_DN5349_c0_g1~~TRINITY_DN5349_c0_g1_i2.p1  ORF type:complete len:257 (-),score=83.82 TRINITY_DN5349_c0_g1_i2:33-734(-)
MKARIIYDAQDKLVVLSIQGTNPTSLTDWMNSFAFTQTDCDQAWNSVKAIDTGCNGGKAHEGFLREWAYGKGTVIPALKTVLTTKSVDKFLITGHSKGAAMAYIAAADLAPKLKEWKVPLKNFWVTTFGSPRAGDKTFSDFYLGLNIPTQRFSISSDPVTMVPLKGMNYEHVGGDASAIPLPCTISNLFYFCHEGYQPVVDVADDPPPTPLLPSSSEKGGRKGGCGKKKRRRR